jgi:predicted extracellular nuclease
MTRWNRWPNGLLVCGATSLVTAGCLSEDPNMDGVMTMTEGTSDPTVGMTSNDPTVGPGDATVSDTVGPDDATVDDTGPQPTGEPEGTTIFEIQNCGSSSVEPGSLVTLTDVVVVSPVQPTDGFVFVQDPAGGQNSGILVYLYADVVTAVPLSPGDVITLTGVYDEFYEESQITVATADDIMVTDTGAVPEAPNVAPSEVVVGAAEAECWEGVPVCLADVTATDATNQFGDFHVDDDMAVTNLFLFDTPDFLDVLPGTAFASLCGPIRYTFEEYKIAPREAADYDATLVDCADAAMPATIYELQQGMVELGTLVLVEDVVVTTPWDFGGDTYWVQDSAGGPFSGISVYMPNAGAFVPSMGDVVTLCGEYDEFFDQSQLQIGAEDDVTASGNGPVPAAEVLTASDLGADPPAEDWEGVLVSVEGVSVTAAADMFGQWQVDDALLLDDVFFAIAAWPDPAVDDVYTSITGVLTFSFEAYKLAPRVEADFDPYPGP